MSEETEKEEPFVMGCRCSSVLECLPSMHKSWASIPSSTKEKKSEKKKTVSSKPSPCVLPAEAEAHSLTSSPL